MSSDNTTVLSFRNAVVQGLNQILFEKLNFSVKKGEHWALTGASGSGKTALLNTIAGKFHIAKGEILHPALDDYIKKGSGADPLFNWHKLIAMVAARHHFKNLSNTSQFYYQQRFNSSDSEDAETVAGYLSSVSGFARRGDWTYDRVVGRLNLTSLLDEQLIKLSNGETKRLLIASSLLRNPLVLLLDNPLTGLDVASRKDFNDLLKEVAASGITIIMATSAAEIPDVISHVAVLNDRKIVKAVEKENYQASAADLQAGRKIDSKELLDLLANTQSPVYTDIIRMENVVIKYGDKTILDHIYWRVRPGERWALLGHNGAGKSTLLSLVNGDNPQAYANKIVLFDRRRGTGESIWDIKARIGFMSPELFQYFPAANSCLQVIESGFYDTLGLFRASVPEKAALAKRWMALLGIETHGHTLFKNVSASVQRLCLLARALVKNPSLLIFDEPCQGLDSVQQEQFRQVVDSICANSNVTLVYVSHYQHEMPSSVTKTLELKNGRVIRG